MLCRWLLAFRRHRLRSLLLAEAAAGANAVVISLPNGKKGYQYLSCNICAGSENLTINKKSCKKCKRDCDHFLGSTKKLDDAVTKKRKADQLEPLDESLAELSKIKRLRDQHADDDPPNPWSNQVQSYSNSCIQPGGVGTNKSCPDLANILNRLSHESVGLKQVRCERMHETEWIHFKTTIKRSPYEEAKKMWDDAMEKARPEEKTKDGPGGSVSILMPKADEVMAQELVRSGREFQMSARQQRITSSDQADQFLEQVQNQGRPGFTSSQFESVGGCHLQSDCRHGMHIDG